jgi:hypothetical protein
MSPRPRCGYTLTEMLVALGVGMVVMQIAFTSFFFIQKFVRRIDRVDGMNQVAQAAVLWSIGKPTKVANFPRGEQISRVGVPLDGAGPVGVVSAGGRTTFTLRDYNVLQYQPIKPYDTFLVVPVQTP